MIAKLGCLRVRYVFPWLHFNDKATTVMTQRRNRRELAKATIGSAIAGRASRTFTCAPTPLSTNGTFVLYNSYGKYI